MVRTGVDTIEIARVQAAIKRHGERFLTRVFTAGELKDCRGRAESLAARFAAKEAVAKALGTGVWRGGVRWSDIEVRRHQSSGAPTLRLYNAADQLAKELELNEWSISLSHDRTYAIAFVVAMRSQ